jgi:hypothetical protein
VAILKITHLMVMFRARLILILLHHAEMIEHKAFIDHLTPRVFPVVRMRYQFRTPLVIMALFGSEGDFDTLSADLVGGILEIGRELDEI